MANGQSQTPFGKFMLPLSLKTGMVFNTADEIFQLVEDDARKLSLTLMSVYNPRFFPNKSNFTSFQLLCKHCSSHTNFLYKNSQFIATTIHHQHTHGGIKFRNKVEQQVYELYVHTKANNPKGLPALREKVLRDYPITKGVFLDLMKRFRQGEERGFTATLQKWLKDKEYDYQLDWGSESHDKYPMMLVMSSPLMRDSYKRFNDIVSFNVIHGLLSNQNSDMKRYKVGAFTVYDTNMRMLLAGVAFLVDETEQAFCQLFRMFFRMHGQPCNTLVSDDIPEIASAVDQLRKQEFFPVYHFIDPQSVLEITKTKLKGKSEDIGKWLSLIEKAIFERDLKDFEKQIDTLINIPQTRAVIEELLQRRQRIFYCYVDSPVFSLPRSSQRISDLLKVEDASERVNFEEFLVRVHKLHLELAEKSASQFEQYKYPVEKLFLDGRIEEVRLHYERKVASRFFQNYLRGLRNYEIVSEGVDLETQQPTFVVGRKKSTIRYQIRNWVCPCNEFGKTGVACPHLILSALTAKSKSYLQLIAKRWRKDRPPAAERRSAEYQVRRKPAMPSRRNIVKAPRKIGRR